MPNRAGEATEGRGPSIPLDAMLAAMGLKRYSGLMDPRETLTAAQGQSGLLLVPLSSHRTDSNVRHIPYAETYRGFSALLKTPVERMQEVADEQSEDSPAP